MHHEVTYNWSEGHLDLGTSCMAIHEMSYNQIHQRFKFGSEGKLKNDDRTRIERRIHVEK